MFRAYLGPSSGGKTLCIQLLVLIFFLDGCLLSWLEDSLLKRIISTKWCIHTVVPPEDGPRYPRNMYRLTKCTKNKLFIKFFFFGFSLYDYIEMHGQQNIKLNKCIFVFFWGGGHSLPRGLCMWDCKNDLLHGDRIATEFQRVRLSYIQIFMVLGIMIMRKRK
jgi:hypothetical protein